MYKRSGNGQSLAAPDAPLAHPLARAGTQASKQAAWSVRVQKHVICIHNSRPGGTDEKRKVDRKSRQVLFVRLRISRTKQRPKTKDPDPFYDGHYITLERDPALVPRRRIGEEWGFTRRGSERERGS